MKLCFATHNDHKLREIAPLLPPVFELLNLEQIGCREELPETQDTIEGNSRQKAEYVWQHYRVNCFADDTGLEVTALGGQPGVHSARYAGPQRDGEENINRLLQHLTGQADRSARFKTVITLVLDGEVRSFEGIVEGEILKERRGEGGFGYDAVFLPDGYDRTFAEMDLAGKSLISHRGRALERMVAFFRADFGGH